MTSYIYTLTKTELAGAGQLFTDRDQKGSFWVSTTPFTLLVGHTVINTLYAYKSAPSPMIGFGISLIESLHLSTIIRSFLRSSRVMYARVTVFLMNSDESLACRAVIFVHRFPIQSLHILEPHSPVLPFCCDYTTSTRY